MSGCLTLICHYTSIFGKFYLTDDQQMDLLIGEWAFSRLDWQNATFSRALSLTFPHRPPLPLCTPPVFPKRSASKSVIGRRTGVSHPISARCQNLREKDEEMGKRILSIQDKRRRRNGRVQKTKDGKQITQTKNRPSGKGKVPFLISVPPNAHNQTRQHVRLRRLHPGNTANHAFAPTSQCSFAKIWLNEPKRNFVREWEPFLGRNLSWIPLQWNKWFFLLLANLLYRSFTWPLMNLSVSFSFCVFLTVYTVWTLSNAKKY